jgi:SlyX protein
MSDDRLNHLEARYAWLERHVSEQDRAMLALGEDVRRLKEELKRVQSRLAASPGPGESEPSDEKPPHY